MAGTYNNVLDIDECISKIFHNHEIPTIEKVCAMSSYSEAELRNSVYNFYRERRKPECSDLLLYYIEDRWFGKLLYAYKFFKRGDNEEHIISFLNKYSLTIEFVDALVKRHPIRSMESYYYFRAALINYYNYKEKCKIKLQNEKKTTAFNLDVRYIKDDLSNKINCIKISNRFIRQKTLMSLGIRCIEV